jgi:hypothetical protein
MLRLDAALASSQQGGAAFVLDALADRDRLATEAADRAAEATSSNAEPCSARHQPHCRRHLCSAGVPQPAH